MGSGRITPMIPNLFSTEPPREQPALTPTPTTPPIEKSAAPSRHILPSDLPAAIKHLSDQELDQLEAAVTAEQQRRGKKPLPSKTESKRTELPAATLTIGTQKLPSRQASHQRKLLSSSEFRNPVFERCLRARKRHQPDEGN